MSSSRFLRRMALLAGVALTVSLVGCKVGGGGGGGSANVRAINLTTDLPSVDVYVGGNKQFSALNSGALSSYDSIDANSYTVNINSAGNGTALFTGSYTFSKNDHYTAVVWGSQTSMRVSTLPEDDDTSQIGTGNTRVRMFNATVTTGTVDVYLTAPGADLSSSTPTQAKLTSGSLAGFVEIPAGTYELRVTGAGAPTDIRLDIPSITLNATQYQTLVLTAGPGGAMVNGTLIVEQAASTSLPNTQSRIRVVASIDNLGQVSANVGGTLISNNLSSPAVAPYVLVTAGTPDLRLLVNGNVVISGPITLAAGADYTLLTWGQAATPQMTMITDDNSLPLTTTQAKIRLVNGVDDLAPATMLVDYGAVTGSQNIAAGAAAPYTNVASDTQAIIEVDSPSQSTPVYLTTRTNGDNLVAQGVFTMWILSGKTNTDGSNQPLGSLRNDRPQ